MTFEIAVDGGAEQRADLDAEDLGLRAATGGCRAGRGTDCVFLDREARHRLVAAGIDGADGHRLPAAHSQRRAVAAVLRLLVRQARAFEQELGAHQADAVADGEVEPVELGRIGDVDQHAHRHAVGGRRRLADDAIRSLSRVALGGGPALRECLTLALVRLDDQAAALAVEQGGVAVRQSSHRRRAPTTIGTPRERASMATWLVGLPCRQRDRRRLSSRSRGSATA